MSAIGGTSAFGGKADLRCTALKSLLIATSGPKDAFEKVAIFQNPLCGSPLVPAQIRLSIRPEFSVYLNNNVEAPAKAGASTLLINGCGGTLPTLFAGLRQQAAHEGLTLSEISRTRKHRDPLFRSLVRNLLWTASPMSAFGG